MTRILGLDIGRKRIGVAVSDEMGWSAHGLRVIEMKDVDSLLNEIVDIIKDQGCNRIVVGLPRRTDGSIGPEGDEVIRFVDTLKERISLPVVLWDERFTTVIAEKTLIEADIRRKRRRKVIDKLAAVLILQNYLDAESHKKEKRSSV